MSETTAKSEKLIAKSHAANTSFPDILGGTTLISAGIILLLNNFGTISWSIWTYFVPFWPVIFIFIGLDIISGNSLLLKLISTSVGLAIVVFIVCYGLTATNYRVRNYLYNNFPIWKNIYLSVPQKNTLDLNQKLKVTPDEYRWDRRGNYWN